MNKDRQDLARYLLQQTADDAPHEPQATEYERLQAALKRLQVIEKPVSVWIGWSEFFVTLHDEYNHDIEVCAVEAKTLLEACEAALTAYDALPENER